MIIQVTETISDSDCQRLMMLYNQHAHFSGIKDQTGHPIVYWNQFRDEPSADDIVAPLVRACLGYISVSTFVDPLYPETVVLAALPRGGCHSPHADNCRQNEGGDWVPNHTPQRDASAIYYLNNDFEGGEIVFTREKMVVTPRRGLLLVFPSDGSHVHEVLPVREGIRYTMPIWFTKQKALALAQFSSQ
jgi:predicted 2-oxoglutarate/Fe(II)-dependent dioxygenase YbiX